MSDELIVLLAPAALGYAIGSLPILRRVLGGQHAAWAACIGAATGFIAFAMSDGGGRYLEPWAPAVSLISGAALAAFHMRQHLRHRGREARARRDGVLMEIRLRSRQDDL